MFSPVYAPILDTEHLAACLMTAYGKKQMLLSIERWKRKPRVGKRMVKSLAIAYDNCKPEVLVFPPTTIVDARHTNASGNPIFDETYQ